MSSAERYAQNSKLMVDMAEIICKNCSSCRHCDLDANVCNLASPPVKPPIKVIVVGCKAHEYSEKFWDEVIPF